MNENLLNILELIYKEKAISRADIARKTALSRPAVSELVNKLLEQNFIRETGKGNSRGGKRPTILEFVPETSGAIGIDIGDEGTIRGILCDGLGKIIKTNKLPYENSYDNIIATTSQIIMELNNQSEIKVCGVGIAVSGIVSTTKNEVTYSSNFDIAEKKLAEFFSQKHNVPVLLGNRARTAAFAEMKVGVVVNCKNFLYISSGVSIGSVIVSDGIILNGANGMAGEIRNIPIMVRNNTELETTTLENALNEKHLLPRAAELGLRTKSREELIELFVQGNESAVKLFSEIAESLAYALNILSGVVDPGIIVLGGYFRKLGKSFADIIREHLADSNIELKLSKSGREAGALGAALNIIIHRLNFELN